MPYKTNAALPKRVRHVLPQQAQTIFREAWNNAVKQYNGNEQKAFAVAWAAVKRKYAKIGDKWEKV